MNPFDYSLCHQTVTIYRKEGEKIIRRSAQGCLAVQMATPTQTYGKSLEKTFRLIIPGDFPILPGDRVFVGEGPKAVDWQTFLPAMLSQVYEVSFAKPCYWDGRIAHWEAGNRKEQV